MPSRNLTVLDTPLLRHKLGYLRDKTTPSSLFRELVKEMSVVLAHEAMRDWSDLRTVEIETPIAKTTVERLANPPVIVSIMRAGNGMLDAVLSMIPTASTGFIGVQRDKVTHLPSEYYFKMPTDIRGQRVLLCDPLVATAGSALASIDRLKAAGVSNIKILSILISEYAVKAIEAAHPDVQIFSVHVEAKMNENSYLVPGLGDAGDRYYQTK